MKALQNNKIIIIAIVVFLIAIGIYKYILKPNDVLVETNATTQGVGKDVLELNANLQTVTLDKTLFGTSLYRSLFDFSTDIPIQSVGRHNPFSPIGSNTGQFIATPPSPASKPK